MNLGQKIRDVRERKKYSQEYLATKLNLSQKAYSNIEANETKLTTDRLFEIAKILEIDIVEILSADERWVYNNYHTHNGEGIVVNKYNNSKEAELLNELLQSEKEKNILLIKLLESQTTKPI